MRERFADKTILITGATGALGRRLIEAFVTEGARVLQVARNIDGEDAISVDLFDADAPSRIITWARERTPMVDVLVNNAATLGPIGPVTNVNEFEWEAAFRVNLFAPVALCRLTAKWMAAGGGGSILNVSGGGATAPRPLFSSYGCSKTALIRFTETLAEETRGQGIRANAMAPGNISSQLTRQVVQAGVGIAGEKEVAAAEKTLATSEDNAARAVALGMWLCSNQSAPLTGKLISAVWDPWQSFNELKDELMASDIYTLRRIVPSERGKDWEKR